MNQTLENVKNRFNENSDKTIKQSTEYESIKIGYWVNKMRESPIVFYSFFIYNI